MSRFLVLAQGFQVGKSYLAIRTSVALPGILFGLEVVEMGLFSLQKWRDSFTNAFLATYDISTADLVHADFCQTYKNARAKDRVHGLSLFF